MAVFEDRERQVFLLIADISGYTRFMVQRSLKKMHGQFIITELMQAVLDEVRMPLSIAKLEGDAVFLYAETSHPAYTGSIIAERLPAFMQAFHRKVEELHASDLCPCAACANITNLDLKIVVHYGTAMFYRIAGLSELSGIDVIIAHRLLKNGVGSNRYIMLTSDASVHVPMDSAYAARTEECEGIGSVAVRVYAEDARRQGVVPKKSIVRRIGFEVMKLKWIIRQVMSAGRGGKLPGVSHTEKNERFEKTGKPDSVTAH